MLVGNRFSQQMQQSVVTALGLITLVVGIQNAFKTGNIIIPLIASVMGVLIGEQLKIDIALENFAGWLQKRFADTSQSHEETYIGSMSSRERFITGFVTASLVFCVGPLTFVGSIQDGMGLAIGFQALMIKSVLDMFAAMAFASTFGVGVLFTIGTIFLIQGGLALIGSLFVQIISDPAATDALASNPIILEMTAVGGILLIGLALILLDIKKPRIANFLPALMIAPLIVWIAGLIGINIYPL
jgi:hypothetical protein